MVREDGVFAETVVDFGPPPRYLRLFLENLFDDLAVLRKLRRDLVADRKRLIDGGEEKCVRVLREECCADSVTTFPIVNLVQHAVHVAVNIGEDNSVQRLLHARILNRVLNRPGGGLRGGCRPGVDFSGLDREGRLGAGGAATAYDSDQECAYHQSHDGDDGDHHLHHIFVPCSWLIARFEFVGHDCGLNEMFFEDKCRKTSVFAENYMRRRYSVG